MHKYCYECGNELVVETSQTQRFQPPSVASEIVCPHCHRDDKVAKVSGIVDSESRESLGVAYGKYQSVYTSSNTTSDLARRLSPPQKPEVPENSILTTLGSLGFLGGLFGIVYTIMQLTPTPGIRNQSPEQGIMIMVVGFGLFVLAIILPAGKGKNKYQEQVEKWKKAIVRWNLAYYCYRSGVVYVKGENTYVDPADFSKILYR